MIFWVISIWCASVHSEAGDFLHPQNKNKKLCDTIYNIYSIAPNRQFRLAPKMCAHLRTKSTLPDFFTIM